MYVLATQNQNRFPSFFMIATADYSPATKLKLGKELAQFQIKKGD
jgi:hypothetical protein